MTVARLIEILSDFPDDLEVVIEIGGDRESCQEIADVHEDPAYGAVFVVTEE